ncbi:hypothetical protein LCGC14_0546520 [marine sediment metagenome]|uniref:DUF3850 domain-containing protein n=1 Tax=marine sediment metagenome TaxID=412755 RepID=A0A0F9S9N5_9ZZZZ
MITHSLKTVNPFFSDIWNGIKKFDVRLNDRDFKVGDSLFLKEYGLEGYRPRAIMCKIIYFFNGYLMLKDGYVILGIKIIEKIEDAWET